MTDLSRQPKDKNYNLITVLYQSSDNVESLKTYIQDAEAEGDQELVEFFNAVLENNLEAAQRAKEMLVSRFQSEQEWRKRPSCQVRIHVEIPTWHEESEPITQA